MNLTFVDEVSRGFAAGLSVRLKDGRRTSLPMRYTSIADLEFAVRLAGRPGKRDVAD